MINISEVYDHAHIARLTVSRSFKPSVYCLITTVEIIETAVNTCRINNDGSLVWIWYTPYEADKNACKGYK